LSAPNAKLLVLCSAAVSAIYAGAYFYTEPGAHAGHSNPVGAVSGVTTPSPTPTGSRSAGHASGPSSTTASRYKDGTYTGSGSNVYGTLSVKVIISEGKITSVQITSYTMHYPQSYIDPTMNNEVVQAQTYRVYIVSGATASSDNFGEAVYQALLKARA
jgi:uncharacterized protein with FMN-binding domain